ncbi:MAG: SURF1 family protein [Devosia sp.]
MTTREGQGERKLSLGLVAFAAFAAACALGFGALGVWQMERMAWKNGLVAAVEARSAAAPLDLDTADWAAIDPEASEYQRVSVSGRFEGADTLSQAVTVYGGGFWVMTPLALDDGRAVLVNRGFVTAAERDAGIPRPDGLVTITGLLRASEPDGGFLRSNDPRAGRWYSRDVAEIGAAAGIDNMAPFFVDAGANARGEAYPIGGLTVLHFSNNHLLYALTWFGLTLLSLFALYWLLRDRLRR